MNNLKPNQQRAKIAIILVFIVLVSDVICFISGYLQYNLLQSFNNGGEISIEKANANDLREQIINIISLIFIIISAITFIQWFRRAYFNLHLKVNNLSHPEGWAAGAWFVPIVNLFRPYHIMEELFVKTYRFLEQKGVEITKKTTKKSLVFWWTLWIINNIFGQIVFRFTTNAVSVNELITSTTLGMIENIIGIPLAFITIKLIKEYSYLENKLFELKEDEES